MSETIPNGWKVKLAEEIYNRLKVPRVYDRSAVSNRGRYPIIDQSEDGQIGFVDAKPEFEGSNIQPLVTFANHTCAVRRMRIPFGVIQNVFPLKGKKDTDSNFIYHVLKGGVKPEGYKGHYPKLREMEFWIPPLPEQKKIASILTSVDEVIENTRKQIEKLRDLKKATMNELLTKGIGHTEFKDSELGRIPKSWLAGNLGSIAQFSGGSAFKEIYQGKFSGAYPFVKVSDMNLSGNERFLYKSNNWITNEIREEAKIKLFPVKSTVFAKVGAALLLNNRRQLVRETAIDNNMMAAVPSHCNHDFLFYFLQTIDLKTIVQSGAVPSVNQKQMESIPVRVPPLLEQKKIAFTLTSMDENIEEKQRKLRKTDSLKKALMQDLLTGKVRVKVN